VQKVVGPPGVIVGVDGTALTVIVTSANEAVQGGLEIVHLTTIVPGPLVGVNVAPGVEASGLNVPVAPPVCIVHRPAPEVGVLPPSDVVVAPLQIVCGPPAVAVVGDCVIVITTSAVAAVHGAFDTVHLRVIGPAPVA